VLRGGREITTTTPVYPTHMPPLHSLPPPPSLHFLPDRPQSDATGSVSPRSRSEHLRHPLRSRLLRVALLRQLSMVPRAGRPGDAAEEEVVSTEVRQRRGHAAGKGRAHREKAEPRLEERREMGRPPWQRGAQPEEIEEEKEDVGNRMAKKAHRKMWFGGGGRRKGCRLFVTGDEAAEATFLSLARPFLSLRLPPANPPLPTREQRKRHAEDD